MRIFRPVLLGSVLLVPGCTSNLQWEGDKQYDPPPATEIVVSGMGINDTVDVLASGALPIEINRSIQNVGQRPVAAGYLITETIERLILQSAAGAGIGFRSGPPAQYQLYSCAIAGPALAPGQTASVSFTFPGPTCVQNPPQPPLPALACGMYKETLTIDATGQLREADEADNEAEHFFFVPSSQPQLNMTVARNPLGDPNQQIVPVQRVLVPAFNYPPPGPVTVTTHTATINTNPVGGGWIYNGISPVAGALSGAIGTLVPAPPVVAAPGTPNTVVNYDISFDPAFLGPNLTGSGPYYVENLDSKVTAISTDGCQMQQKRLLTTLLFEERP